MKKLPIDFFWEPNKINVSPRKDSPKVIFLTSETGVEALEVALRKGLDVEKVISEDRGPVKRFARVNNIPFEGLNEKTDLTSQGLGKSIDYAIVAFTDYIVPADSVAEHTGRIVGAHVSDLTKAEFRGGYPLEAALLDDKKSTSIVTFLINERIDEGPVLMRQRFYLTSAYEALGGTASSLYGRAASTAGELLAKTLFNIKRLSSNAQEQKGEPTYAKPLKQEDLTVNWGEHTAQHIINMFRAGERVYTRFKGSMVKIGYIGQFRSKLPRGTSPGEIFVNGKVCVATEDGKALILSNAKFTSERYGNLEGYLRTDYFLHQKPTFG